MSEKLTKSEQRERRLNLACTEAKAAAKAAPDDAALAAAYVKAKAAFKKHQQRREQRAEASAAAAAPAPAATDSWTCAVCGITISIADPRAKEQHLAGKAHAKKAKAAGASIETPPFVSAFLQGPKTGRDFAFGGKENPVGMDNPQATSSWNWKSLRIHSLSEAEAISSCPFH